MLEVYKNILTAAGADLHARSIAGEKMQITRFALGNGVYTGTETDDAIRKMTALKSQKNNYGVSAVETISESTCKITMIATNEGITEGYYVTELGIFAAGSDGKEVLYSIIVADPAKPDWMSAYNAVAPSSLRYYNFVSVGNAANVTVKAGSGAVATTDDLDEEHLYATAMSAENWRMLRMHGNDIDALKGLTVDVPMTNTLIYPHNNSQQTVSLSAYRNNKDYYVIPEVLSHSGTVGDIEITDKLVNGFKIAYTGAATATTIRCHVIGGM